MAERVVYVWWEAARMVCIFTADTLRYAVTLNFNPVTFTFDLWPWNNCSILAASCWKSVQNLSVIEKSAAELLQFDLEYVSRVALCSAFSSTPPLIFTGSQKVWTLTSIFDTTLLWAAVILKRSNISAPMFSVWCSDNGALFSPNSVQFSPPLLRSRFWKYSPWKIC